MSPPARCAASRIASLSNDVVGPDVTWFCRLLNPRLTWTAHRQGCVCDDRGRRCRPRRRPRRAPQPPPDRDLDLGGKGFRLPDRPRVCTYQRLDARINKYFYSSKGKITVFLHIINLYNHENISSFDHEIRDETADSFRPVIETETFFSILPFVGVSWEF